MNIKKFLKLPIHYRNLGLIWKYGGVVRKLGLIHLLIPALLIPAAAITFNQTPNIRLLAAKFIKPKPIVQSSTILSANIQSSIQNLASQEIKAETANANLAINSNLTQTSQGSLIQPLIDTIQETLTSDPSSKAKIKLRVIDSEIAQLQNLLEKDKSDKAADQAVKLITDIGKKTGGVVTDPKVQIDREILKLQIEQYNRLQLILQKLEDSLPITSYLKIEDAREKYLVSGAQASLNAAPNLDAVHNIAVKEVGRIVGDDFSELKAIEILSDIESGLNPETKVKLAGLQKELAVQFEKRMLKLPSDVRNRKLQNYINYSFGNPLNQIRSFNQIQQFLTDRELILGIDSLKELALKRFEDRLFELATSQLPQQLSSKLLNTPENLKIFIQAQMDIESGTDKKWALLTGPLSGIEEQAIVELFGKDKNKLLQAFPQNSQPDLLDILVINKLDKVLTNSLEVSSEINQEVRNIKQRQIQNFVANIAKKDFVTQAKLGYNPVPANADVRLLLPDPNGIILLEEIRQDLSTRDKSAITTAEKATTALLANHLLLHINDPELFREHEQIISTNPQVKQLIQNYLGQSFLTNLAKKKQAIDKLSKEDEQKLYEKMQAIVQQIFVSNDNQKSDLEKQLPTEIQNEIQKLKTELADNNVPKIETPEGVTLPEIAKLPSEVEKAIIVAAQNQIDQKNISTEAKLDLTVQAKDLGVSEPTILPGNLLYPVLETLREIPVLLTSNPIDKAEKQLAIDNERTLEAAKLLEGSQSQETVNLALQTLDKINQDFDLLKAHVDDLKKEDPAKVDKLVDQIIENGLARQTVLSSIENKVYGDDYVKVETDRQAVLKNGIAVLLELTNEDAQKLTDKLEAAVQSSRGSDLKDIKAVELLTEIARTQPESIQQVLEKSEANLAKDLETKLLAMPKEQRTKEVLAYAESAPGNPIRQFEAYDSLKSDFKNPEIIALAEGLKDKAVENLTAKISEITDASSRQEFVDSVVGNQPQDLKIITEIEQRIAPVETTTITEILPTRSEALPIVEKIADIKAEVEQNIIDTYKDKPEELVKTDFYQSATASTTVDIVDVKVAQEIITALTRSPEVSKEVIAVAKQEETKIIDTLVANISKPEFQTAGGTVTTLAAETLNPVPQTLAELIALKAITPPAIDAKIDIAIKTEVSLIEVHLTTQVNDPATFQAYVAQIEQNPLVTQTITQVGGTQFTQAVEQKAQIIETQATTDKTQLQTTVTQITQEIFSAPASSPSVVEQTLPQTVQQEIAQIKQEVPKEQIPAVEVQATVTVTAPTPAASSVPTTNEPVQAPVVAPAPAAPEVKPPEPAQPAAPPPAVGL